MEQTYQTAVKHESGFDERVKQKQIQNCHRDEIISIVAGKLSQGSSSQFPSGEGSHKAFLLQKAMLH